VVPWWSRDGGESLVLVGGLLVVVGGENFCISLWIAATSHTGTHLFYYTHEPQYYGESTAPQLRNKRVSESECVRD
jgi:hypothetical protein